MLVSVVIPALNEEKYIGACLQALQCQKHAGFDVEVIVVDDGSTDGTASIARGYGARVICQMHRGVSGARQAGFEAALGDIIASMDADTVPPTDWLTRLVAELSREPETVGVYGPFRLCGSTRIEETGSQVLSTLSFWVNNCAGKPTFSGQNFAVRREAWAHVGGFDPDWACCEDTLLSLKLAKIGRVKFCGSIVVPTSARRIKEGYWNIFKRSLSNYFRVMWFHARPLAFPNLR